MLIRFQFENFLSFKKGAELSMVAGRSTQHLNHKVVSENSVAPDILRTAALFGKNASGKSNFINALSFARNLILHSPSLKRSIGTRPFKLDDEYTDKPSKFSFELLIDSKVYAYGFTVSNKEVLEEWLYEIKKTTEVLLFKRKNGIFTFGKIDYSKGMDISMKPTPALLKQQEQRLYFVGDDTISNQLFLTASIEREQPYFKEVYNWFDNSLYIIRPDSAFLGLEFQIIDDKENNFIKEFEEILKSLDTDIAGLQLVEVDIEKEIIKSYPDISTLKEALENIEPGTKSMFAMPDERRFAIKKEKNGQLKCFKLMTKHKKKASKALNLFGDDQFEFFEINWESQGTQRLLDLIPMLFLMKNSSSTIIVDELARSLHPELSYGLVRSILDNKLNFKSQLIFTSHEDYLLDFELLRRDEVWFVDKNSNGESSIYSLEEFKPRYDKDIRKGYLTGRFGAIPVLDYKGLSEVLSH